MNIEELNKWYSMKEYDPESKELNRILRLGKVKGKDILVIGMYGAVSISFKLHKYAKSIISVHSNRQIINYCKKKSKEIDFRIGKISNLQFPDKMFDIIISPWSGLHYQKNKSKIIKGLKRILKNKGLLLIEEADETSEFVKILNFISPKRKSKIKEKRAELRRAPNKEFKVGESRLSTYYDFKSENQFKGYFKKEIVFEEKKKFTKEMEKRLNEYISKKRTLRVGEKSIFFVCRKK